MNTVAPKAPSRSMSKMVIQFGPISVPVQVFNGVEEDANKFPRSMRAFPSGNPVNYVTVDSGTGEVIPRSETIKVYVFEDGTEVPLSDDEMHDAVSVDNGTCELIGFYDASLIGTYVPKQVFQVRPQTVKSGSKVTRPYDKAFYVFMQAMRERGNFALLRYVVRGSMHLGGLLPTGELLEFYWPNEIRQSLPMPEVENSDKEVLMASLLMDTMTDASVPLVENTAAASLATFVQKKFEATTKGEKFDPAKVAEQTAKDTTDLLAQLQASLDKAKSKVPANA